MLAKTWGGAGNSISHKKKKKRMALRAQLAVFATGLYYNLYFINAETEKSELFA